MLIRITISVSIFAGIFVLLEPEDLWLALSSIETAYLILAVIILIVIALLSGLRWFVMLRAIGIKNRLPWIVLVRLISQGANTFVPGGVAGDLLALLYLRSPDQGLSSRVIGTLIADRVIGLGSSFVILFIAVGVDARLWSNILYFEISGSLASVIAVSSLFFIFVFLKILKYFRLNIYENLKKQIASILRTFLFLIKNPAAPVFSFLVSLVQNLLAVFAIALLAIAFGKGLFWPIAASLSLTTIASLVPITFNGLGIREVVFIWLLDDYGILPRQAIALGFTFFTLTLLVTGILGAVSSFFTPLKANKAATKK